MSENIEQRQFADINGLEQFWADVQTYLTRNYKDLPSGMQFSRIYQQGGQLHILVESFGGSTAARKLDSRTSLDVYSKAEVDSAIAENGGYQGQKTLYEMNHLSSEPHNGDSFNVQFGPDDSAYIDPSTGFGRIYNLWDGRQEHSYVEVLTGDNVIYDRKAQEHAWDRQTGNYKHKQHSVSESFQEYETLLDISQDENGEITVHTQTIPTATVRKLGLTTLKGVIGSMETDNSTAATPKAVRDAIDTAIGALDFNRVTLSQSETVGTISETDGVISVTKQDILVGESNIDNDAITADKVKDGESLPVDISGTAAYASDVVQGSKLESKLNSKADKVTGATGGNLASLDASGNLTDSGYSPSSFKTVQTAVSDPSASGTSVSFIDTLSQDANGEITVTKKNVQQASTSSAGIVQLSNEIDSTSETMAATPKAVHDAIIEAEQATVAGLNAENDVPDGHYITSVDETDGIVSITTAEMDSVPTQDSSRPVKSGGVFASIGAEANDRAAADAAFQQLIPTAASAYNQLADKAYVDAIGERVEARYLSYSQDGLPFPTYDDFVAAQQTDTFYYMNALTAPNNNDVIVITADRTHLNDNNQPTTTRWRFFKPETGPGEWRYEYTINNSALNEAQLLAINSGINAVKVGNYDAHLIDHENPHQVTAAQVGLGNVDNTADLDKPISTATQDALDEKADNVVDGTANNIVVLGDNGKTLVDSHAAITSSYDGTDETNPVTGSAVAAAIGELDAGPFGGEGKYIISVSETAGVVSATEGTLDAEPTENSTNPVKSGGVYQHLSTKADKDTDAVEANVAVFDENGNPVDSGISKDDLEEAISSADSSIQGVSIDGTPLTPDASNVADIPLATTSSDGAMSAEDKSKLDGIASGAEVNVQADWTETDSESDAFVRNKPILATVATTGEYGDLLNIPDDLVRDGDYVHTDNNYTDEEKAKLAGVESGAEVNVQADWTESDSNSDAFIQNKPENLVQDANYVHTDNNYTTAEKEKLAGIETGAEVNVIDTVNVDGNPLTVTDKTVNIDLSGKADKASNATDGNLAALDEYGNLKDSGSKASDFKTRQDSVADPAASGTSLSFIDTLEQDENGKITATKKTVTIDDTYNALGANPVNGQAVADAIGSLDSDMTGEGTNVSVQVVETDGKIAEVIVTDNTASVGHVHGNITSEGKIGSAADLSVVTGADGVVTASDLSTPSPGVPSSGTTTSLSFIDTVSQDSKGKIAATKKNVPKASTSAAGIVQLYDDVDSTNTSMAATANAVKEAYDHADSIVSDLDAEVASADGTNVQVKVTETDGKVSAVSVTTDNTENRYNKVTEWSATTTDTNYPSEKLVKGSLDGKVDKEAGKGLSTNDYTDSDKEKLDGIAAGAEVNQNAFSSVTVGSVTVEADSKTDTLELAGGTGIAAEGDATGEKVTFSLDSSTQTSLGKADNSVQSVRINGGNDLKDAGGNVNIPLAVAAGSDDSRDGALSSADKKKIDDLGSAAYLDVPVSGNAGNSQVVLGSDTRLAAGESAVQDVTVGGTSVVDADTRTAAIPDASTDTRGAVQLAGTIGATVSTENGKAATEKAVRDAINALDVSSIIGFGKSKTLASLTETDGKIAATFQDILAGTSNIADDAVTASKVKDGETLPVSISGNAVTATTAQDYDATSGTIKDALDNKEDKVNKVQTISSSATGLTDEYPSAQAVIDFVNSSIATGTANFLGNKDVVDDLGLTTSATNQQIESALGTYVWPSGIVPTNNDYVFATLSDTPTPGLDEYRRFKYDGSTWQYEYTINNSSFTQAQWAAINSGLSATDKDAYDGHVADTAIHVTSADKDSWTAKYDKPASGIPASDLSDGVQASLAKADSAIQGVKLYGASGSLPPDSDKVVTIPDAVPAGSTGETNGLMTAADKAKLDGISSGSNKVEPSATNGNIKIDGTETTVYAHPAGSAPSKTGVPAGDATPGFGGTFTVSQVKTDATSHVSAITTRTITIPNATAVASAGGTGGSSGLMSASDKEKLNGIATGAEVNQNAFSNVKVGSATVAADTKTDTLELATTSGKHIVLTADTANDKVTIDTDLSSKAAASGGTAESLVTTGEKYTWNSKASGTHTHGNITNDGKIGSTAELAVVTGTSGAVTTTDLTTASPSVPSSGTTTSLEFIDTVSQDSKGKITATKKTVLVDSTYSATGTNPVNGNAIAAALGGLDSNKTSTDGTNVQVKVTETDGKISAVNITTDNTENRNNKVTAWSATTTDTHYPSEKLVKTSLDGKVDKVEGKGLSTEDYTTAEKTKLAGIAAGAEVNQNAFSNVKVGSTTVAADSKTGTLELASSSAITLTPDATNDKVTIGVSTMGAASSSTAGTAGIVPAPGAGKQASFLRGDGTWVVPTNTDTLVKATAKTDNVNYKILATASASPTSGNATEAVYDTDISLNPSTNTITSNISGNAATATKPAVTTLSSTDDLNSVSGSSAGDVRWYKWPSGSPPSNVPSADTSVMEVVRTHSNSYITQTVYTTSHSVYRRECVNGTWGAWYSYSKSTHTHGNITSGGALQTTDVAIANGDKLVITDASDSNKIARSSTAFDGSTITKALTQKGTFESVMLADDAMPLSATDGVKITYSGSTATISGNFAAGAGVGITYANNVATFSADISAIPLATIYALS